MFVYHGKAKIFDHSYAKELTNLIHQSYETGNKSSNNTNFSYILEKILSQSAAGEVLDFINCSFTLIEAIFYIISTYTYPELKSTQRNTNHVLEIIETVFLVYFILHYILRLYCSQTRILYILDILNLVDISSIVCIILSRQSFVETKDADYFFKNISNGYNFIFNKIRNNFTASYK